ncbi:hypothetical protein, partial [Paenibacillus elgii]|uniref:hypothetical protein n=1 Tax=Paenibacillus elgii TaxID=189691 RepID=UPI00203AFC15
GRHSRSDSGIHYSSSRVFPSGAFWGILGAVILAPIRNSLFQQPGYSLQAHSGAFWAVILAPIREFIIPAA